MLEIAVDWYLLDNTGFRYCLAVCSVCTPPPGICIVCCSDGRDCSPREGEHTLFQYGSRSSIVMLVADQECVSDSCQFLAVSVHLAIRQPNGSSVTCT